jgi:hypothetical protein
MEIRQLRQRRQHEWAEQKEVLIQFIEGVGPPVAASAAGAGY